LRFAHELRPAEDLPLPPKNLEKLGVSAAEQRMADTLVQGMHDEWKPEQYKDTFRDDVLALVEKKAKAGEVNTVAELPHEKRAPKQKGNVVDLMEMLKRSLGEKGIPNKPGPKKAHHPKRRKSA
ncbi:MAG TPA: Ku protein, partial [Polyangiaceae bacterium]|nr:Ku protein [Polyangiaceae bacterium]